VRGSKAARVVVLSPHFDDAPLSLGQSMLDGELAAEREAVGRVLVGVVFGRTNWQRWFHPTARRAPIVSAIRRAEELENARRFGYRIKVATNAEVILRTGDMDSATFLDPGLELSNDLLDDDLVEEIAASIQPWTSEASRVIAPLGLGGHVDHRLVREAARRIVSPDRLEFFEDRPYASYLSDADIATMAHHLDAVLAAHDMSPADTRPKTAKCWYPSQFDPYFLDAMAADYQAARPERVWRHPR